MSNHITKRQLYSPSNYLFSVDEYTDKAIERVKQAYDFSQMLNLGKLYVCFSGGKDSVALYGICKLAFGNDLFDKCDFEYNVTGIDHPELVHFIKQQYPFVHRNLYKKSMWQLILDKGMPPTRLMRYCCQELKEHGGEGRFCLTGVRWEESSRRANHRGEFESDGKILNADNSDDRRLLEHCIPKRKHICNPSVDWTYEMVWRFIIDKNLPYCDLYDKGYERLGCIGCPMDTHKKEVLEAYPKYKAQYLRTFKKMLNIREQKGLKTSWNNEQEVYDWW